MKQRKHYRKAWVYSKLTKKTQKNVALVSIWLAFNRCQNLFQFSIVDFEQVNTNGNSFQLELKIFMNKACY